MLSQDLYLVLDPISARKKIRAAVKSVTNRARWGDSLLLLIKKNQNRVNRVNRQNQTQITSRNSATLG